MLLEASQYDSMYQKIAKAVAVLISQKKLSTKKLHDWKYVTSLTDPLKRYQEAMRFFNKHWDVKNLDAILKQAALVAPVVPPVMGPTGAVPGELTAERLKKLLAYYNKAIHTLHKDHKIPIHDYRNYLDIGKNAKDDLELYKRIREWYAETGLPDIKQVYQQYQQAFQAKKAKAAANVGEIGIDLTPFPEPTQNLIKTYAKSLEKLTGKHVTLA